MGSNPTATAHVMSQDICKVRTYVDHADAQVVDEQDDVGSGVGSSIPLWRSQLTSRFSSQSRSRCLTPRPGLRQTRHAARGAGVIGVASGLSRLTTAYLRLTSHTEGGARCCFVAFGGWQSALVSASG